MKRDKARTITQERVQDAIEDALLDFTWHVLRPVSEPFSAYPRDIYDKRKLHHYDPTPVRRAVAKKRRWRI